MITPLDRKVLCLALGVLVPGLLVLACSSEPEPPPGPAPRVGASSDFYTVAPCRIVDTRTSGPLTNAQPRTFPIAGQGCDIPKAAVAVASNMAILETTGQGVVIVRADPDRGPLEMSFEKTGVPRSTSILLPLSPDGSITATVQGNGTAHILLDVSGYFLPEGQTPEPPVSSSAPPR